MKKFRRLFEFRQPRVRHLNCIDLVFENKIILLLGWELLHAHKVCIQPGNIKKKSPGTAFIVTLPSGTSCVHLTISNYWRSLKLSLPLRHISLDRRQLELLGDEWDILRSVALHNLQPNPIIPELQLSNITASIKRIAIIPSINIYINHSQFGNYVP